MSSNDKLIAVGIIVLTITGLMSVVLEVRENPLEVAVGSVIVSMIALVAFSLIYCIPKDSE